MSFKTQKKLRLLKEMILYLDWILFIDMKNLIMIKGDKGDTVCPALQKLAEVFGIVNYNSCFDITIKGSSALIYQAIINYDIIS